MRQQLDRLRQNSFVRSAAVLVGGTAFGQIIALLALPLLTRLYTPQDFSVLAVYAGLLGLMSVAASLRFEIAIPLPEKDSDALTLLVVALSLAALVSCLLAVPALLFPRQLAQLFGQPAFQAYVWLLPIGVMLVSTYSAVQFWATRDKQFALIARTRMVQAVGGAGTQLTFGVLGLAPVGLLIGHMISSGAGAFGLGRRVFADNRTALSRVGWAEMCRLFRDYDRFPKYSSFEAFANIAGIQVPMLIIAATALRPEAGFLVLAMRVMQAPIGLIGSAVGQVYLSRAPDEDRAGRLGVFTANIMGGLIKTGVGPLAFAGVVAPGVFAIVFGEEWHRAGVLVAWMTPWFILQFLASPVSMALHVTNQQRLAFLVQLFGLILRVGLVVLAMYILDTRVSEVYAVSGLIFYAGYLALILRVVGCSASALYALLKAAFLFVLPWLVGGLLCNYLIGQVFAKANY